MTSSIETVTGERHWITQIREDAFSIISGWVNPLTGAGDASRDKSAAAVWAPGMLMEPSLLASLFTFNALARAICMALPEWALRNGWDLTLDRDAVEAQEIESRVRAKLADLGAHEVFLSAAVWGQTFGGGLVLIGAADGRESAQPLDEKNLRSIEWLRVVPRHRVSIRAVYSDPRRPKYGEPAIYEVREIAAGLGAQTQRFHESRVIRFPGPLTDEDAKARNQGWDQSILDVVIAALRKHDGMWDDVGAMTHDASQGVWKIKDLARAATTGLGDAIQARFRLADQARSMFRSLLLDADKEDFQYVHRNFAGISDLLGQSAIRTAGAAQMPVTVLMGQSPAGLNATGESDLELWYGRARAYQTDVIVSRLECLIRLVLLSKDGPTRGIEPETWAVEMRDVRSLTPMQRAELRARQAQVDTAMIAAKVLTPEEVAISRYTSEGWSDATQIDVRWRRDFLRFASQTISEQGERLFAAQLQRWLGLVPEGVPPPSAVTPSQSNAAAITGAEGEMALADASGRVGEPS
jgi:uncharacterized protein